MCAVLQAVAANKTGTLQTVTSVYPTAVGVLDTGVQCNHPDLNVVFTRQFNIERNPDPSQDGGCYDGLGHGTHVAGVHENDRVWALGSPGFRVHFDQFLLLCLVAALRLLPLHQFPASLHIHCGCLLAHDSCDMTFLLLLLPLLLRGLSVRHHWGAEQQPWRHRCPAR